MVKKPSPGPAELALLDPDGAFQERLRADHQALLALRAKKDLEPLRIIAHQLAGAAATFGYPELGDVAIELDEHLRGGSRITPRKVTRLLRAIEMANLAIARTV